MYVVLHINFFLTVKNNKMTTLAQFEQKAILLQDRTVLNNTDFFFYSLKDYFFDAYLENRTKNVESIILNSDYIWNKFLGLITNHSFVIDLDYLQCLFNFELIEFKNDLQNYFA
jgi:hypothetical protein